MEQEGHVSERFARLLDLYRRPDGSEWGCRDLERATGGSVTRSYVANLRGGLIGSPGLDKLAAISEAMGFPPGPWFEESGGGREVAPDGALVATLRDQTTRAILEEATRMGARERRLLLGIAREIAAPPEQPSRGRAR